MAQDVGVGGALVIDSPTRLAAASASAAIDPPLPRGRRILGSLAELAEVGVRAVRLSTPTCTGSPRQGDPDLGLPERGRGRRRVRRGDHDRRPAPQRDRRASSRASRTSWPGPTSTRSCRCPGTRGGRVHRRPRAVWTGEPYAVRLAGGPEARVGGFVERGVSPGARAGARVLPVRARSRPSPAAGGATSTRTATCTRSARWPIPGACCRGCSMPRRVRARGVRRRARVRPRAVRDQPAPLDALYASDRAFLFKATVKEMAARDGLLATFMGKPWNDDEGSGFHLHISLGGRRRAGTSAGRLRRATRGWLRAAAPLHRGRARARAGADGVLQPHHERLPADPRGGARADARVLGPRQPA